MPTAYEFIYLMLQTSGKIDILWNMFIAVHTAVFGILYTNHNPIKKGHACSVIFLYVCFLGINYSNLLSSYKMLDHLVQTFQAQYKTAEIGASSLGQFIGDFDFFMQPIQAAVLFFIAGLSVVWLLWARVEKPPPKKTKS